METETYHEENMESTMTTDYFWEKRVKVNTGKQE